MDVPVYINAPLPPWLPVDLAKPDLPSNIKIDPRVQAIQEEMATQVEVCEEKEIRVKEVLENTKTRDSRHPRWVRAMKKADKDLKIEKAKLNKLRPEEENVLAEIGELEKTK